MVCYTIVDASQWQRVWLISGELGGEKHTIDGVAAAKIDRGGPIPAGCPLLPSRYHRLSLDNGVWLGSSRKYLIRRIGTPSREVGPTIDFWYEGKIKVKMRELGESRARWVDFDVGNGLTCASLAKAAHAGSISMWEMA